MKNWTWVAFITGAYFLLRGGEKKTPKEFLVLGDSIGVGIANALRRQGLMAEIQDGPGLVEDWASGWVDRLVGRKNVIVSLGTYNINSKKMPWHALETLDRAAKAGGVKPLWINPATEIWEKIRSGVVMPSNTLILKGIEKKTNGDITERGYDQAAALILKKMGG